MRSLATYNLTRHGLLFGMLFSLIISLSLIRPAWPAEDTGYRLAGGLAIYLGVVPAQLVRDHAPSHPEREMHDGIPAGKHQIHVLVALFDAKSGARISDAIVKGHVSGLGHTGITQIDLQPMTIADTITYGAYVSLPGDDRYTIRLEITPPSGRTPIKAEFGYQHGARP